MSNYRLKLPARGRSVAELLRSPRAGSLAGALDRQEVNASE